MMTNILDRKATETFFYLGQKAMNRRDYNQAIILFNRAIVIDSEFLEAHNFRRKVLQLLKMQMSK